MSGARRRQRYAQQRKDAMFTLALGGVSIAALLWYYAHQQILLYGDAVAHINIARRVLDNRSWLSSFFQLGTVWLPLPHILMLPFVWNKALWMSGIAGSDPEHGGVCSRARWESSDWSAHAHRKLPLTWRRPSYALNPNLLYMQSTAMNEPLFLAFFIWAIVYFDEWLRGLSTPTVAPDTGRSPERALEGCGIALAGGAATRYDGWFFGAIMGVLVLCGFVRWWRATPDAARRRSMTKSLAEFLLLNALVPVFWLAYNHRVSGHAMDWANGPYSAKAIAERTTARGAAPYPGKDHVVTAGLYFLKAAKLNVGPGHWGDVLFVLALLGTAVALWRFRQYSHLAAAVGPTGVLRAVDCVRQRADLHSDLVAVLVLQRAIWAGTACRCSRYFLCCWPRCVAESVANHEKESDRLECAGAAGGGQLPVDLCGGPITLKEAQVNARTRMILEDALAQVSGGPAAIGDSPDVPGRACRGAAAGRHSAAPCHQRNQSPGLGVGTARSGATR